MSRPLCLSLTLPLALVACGGEFAYKPGAGADALAQAKLECAKTGGPYEACMQGKGWTVHQLSAENPLAVFVTTADTRASPEPVFVAADKPTNTPASASGAADAAAATGTTAPKPPPDPLTRFKVSSWWKMGGGAADLKTSMAACVDKLGPAHQPDMAKQLMTRSLILCLRDKGWYGLQGY